MNKFKFDQKLTANYFAPLCGLCVHRVEEDEKKCAECFLLALTYGVEDIKEALEEFVE